MSHTFKFFESFLEKFGGNVRYKRPGCPQGTRTPETDTQWVRQSLQPREPRQRAALTATAVPARWRYPKTRSVRQLLHLAEDQDAERTAVPARWRDHGAYKGRDGVHKCLGKPHRICPLGTTAVSPSQDRIRLRRALHSPHPPTTRTASQDEVFAALLARIALWAKTRLPQLSAVSSMFSRQPSRFQFCWSRREYGGRYQISHPASSMISLICSPLWKLALSIIIMSPGCSWGIKHFLSPASNKSRLQHPSKVKGENNWPSFNAETQLTRSVRFPDLRA